MARTYHRSADSRACSARSGKTCAVEFRILGPLEVRRDGRALDLPAQQRVVLAVLLAEPNRIVSSERLIDALWDDDPPHTARKALQVHVSQLRKLLGRERIETAPPGYRLRVDDGELDLARFLRLQDERRFDEALELWRRAPLADLAHHRFVAAEPARLGWRTSRTAGWRPPTARGPRGRASPARRSASSAG